MRLFVLDPSLTGHSGHHYNYNRAILDECRRRGMGVAFLSGSGCLPEVVAEFGAAPCFSVSTYAMPDVHPHDRVATSYVVIGHAIERDLQGWDLGRRQGRFPGGDLTGEDVVLFHTAVPQQVLGLLRWYEALERPRPRLLVQFMFPPWFRSETRDRDVCIAFHARALRAAGEIDGGRVRFVSDSVPLAGYLTDLAGVPVGTLPMPISFPPLPPSGPGARGEGPLTFCYLGEPRAEKGFFELMHALLEHRAGAPRDLRFAIQVAGIADPDFLDRLRNSLPGDLLIEQPVSERVYWDLIANADALLLPYDGEAYRLRSSRVLVEAIGMGKPVLVTEGTWMDGEAARLGAAGVRTACRPDAIWKGIMDLVGDNRALAAAAMAAAEPCRLANSPRSFIDSVMDAAR